MAEHKYNLPLIIMIIVVILTLLVSVVFNALAAIDTNSSSCSSEKKARDAHKWSTWSAVINGISVIVVAVVLILYFIVSREEIWKQLTNPFQTLQEGTAVSISNTFLILSLIGGIILLFVSMVLSSMAASDINSSSCSLEKDARDAHKWATISAILNAFAVLILGFTLGFYLYVNREDYKKSATENIQRIRVGLEGKYPQWTPDDKFPESPKKHVGTQTTPKAPIPIGTQINEEIVRPPFVMSPGKGYALSPDVPSLSTLEKVPTPPIPLRTPPSTRR